MNRRQFLAASGAAAFGMDACLRRATAAGDAAIRADRPGGTQLIELRTYHFPSPAKREAFERFLSAAAIPALNRAGVRPAGAFKLVANDNPELKPAAGVGENDLFVLLPH